jgi:CubicO group peptidase (beta-lactamase class C family)
MANSKNRRIHAAIVVAVAVSATIALRSAEAPAIPAAGRAAIQAFLNQAVEERAVPAVVAIVVNRQQQMLLDAAGKRDVAAKADIAVDSIFRIASMTKPITSTAIMMLYEKGQIGLDDPVAKYLPEFDGVRVVTAFNDADGTFQSRPAARPITIRHLLTHTSGIGYSFSDSRLARLDDGKKREWQMPLLHDPGVRFTYGPSTAVLGYVIEKVSGQPLEAYLKSAIFDPLGMGDTAFSVPPGKKLRVVTQHVRAKEDLAERPNPEELKSNPRGDGGLFSTASDYGRFMQMILNGGRTGSIRLLKDDTLRLMTSNQIGALTIGEQPSANPLVARPFPFGSGKDQFGFGFQIETPPAAAGLRNAGSLSWGGINNTHFWIDPKQQIAGAVLMQILPYYDDAAIGVLRGVERLVYQHLRVQS